MSDYSLCYGWYQSFLLFQAGISNIYEFHVFISRALNCYIITTKNRTLINSRPLSHMTILIPRFNYFCCIPLKYKIYSKEVEKVIEL